VLPIAFSYDHVPEESAFIDELGGAAKPPMQLRGLLRWTRRLLKHEVSLGRAHIACGQPVMLEPNSDVYAVSHDIMAELQNKTVATTHHLRTFLECEKDSLEDIDLPWLRDAITRRGGSVLDTKHRDQLVSPLIERCMHYQFEHLFYAEALLAFAGHLAIENHIRLNRFAQIGPPNPAMELQDPRVLSLIRSLFGPVVRDYQAVADALGEPGTPLDLNSPVAVMQSRRDENLHLPGLESAFADLTERRILLYDQDEKSYSWGPEAAEIASYRSCLVRI
jgi:hypothetical protein